MGISTPLDTPFNGDGQPGPAGSGATQVLTPDVPYFAPVAIQGHAYQIDVKQYQRTTLEAQRQPVDQSQEPGEQTLNTEGLWRRSQENWVLGAGQYYLDNIASLYSLYERAGENQSLRYRFWCSKNVNVWTSGQMSLLPLTEKKYSAASGTLTTIAAGNYLYIVTGTSVQFTSNPTAASPTWTSYAFQSSGTPGTITSITTDGTSLYAACSANGVWSIPLGVTSGSAKIGTITPDFIVYGNGRLVCGTGPVLVELNHDGTTTTIGSHKNPSWFWTCGCSASGAIYIGGKAGNVGEIYSVSIASSAITGGTALTPPTLAAPLPPGELVNAMCFTGGYLAIGTSMGFRIADISSSATAGLTFGPVIVIANGVSGVAAWGEFVYFTWSKYTAPSPTNPAATIQSSGIGRADLGRFTSALVPAYASDLQIDDSASGSTNWTITSVAVLAGLPYFAGVDGGAVNVYVCGGNATKFAASGMFQSGWTRFNTVEAKNVASVDYHHDSLEGGSVQAYLVLETGSVIALPASNVLNTLGPTTPFATNYQAGEAFNTQVTINADATQLITPVLRRYTVRALITPKRMDEIIVPIIMKSRVEGIQGEGSEFWQSVLAEYQFLWGLCNAGLIITYQEGSQAYTCYLDRVQVKPEKWDDDRDFYEGSIICRLLTIPVD